MSELSEGEDIAGPRASAAARPARLALIDAGRGLGLVGMAIYHFSWDLTSFGYAKFDLFGDPWWLAFRAVVLSSFLFIAGLSQWHGQAGGLDLSRAGLRLAKITAAAGAITLGSWWLFPESYIFFGVLHHIAVVSVLLALLHRLPAVLLPALAAGVVATTLAAPIGALFDTPGLVWLGLASYLPRSNDFVPMLPWLAVGLIGAASAPLARRRPAFLAPLLAWRGKSGFWRFIRLMGRHSLLIYLAHQPVLIGGLYLWAVFVAG